MTELVWLLAIVVWAWHGWEWYINRDTRKAADFGKAQGWKVRQHTFLRKPKHWATFGHPVYGFAGLYEYPSSSRRVCVAEVAGLPWTRPKNKAAALWHEFGHCQQYDAGQHEPPPTKWHKVQEEIDAWERGLALAFDNGFKLDRKTAVFVLECLVSYENLHRIAREPFVQWLIEETI